MGFNIVGHGVVWRGNSIRGEGFYGHLESQSIEGSGSVSGIPYTFVNSGNGNFTVIGFFVKFPAAPSVDTTLLDLDGGVNGHFRLKLTSAPRIILEVNLSSVSGSVDICGTNLSPNTWYWVTAVANSDRGAPLAPQGEVFGPGGISVGGARWFSGSGGGGVYSFNMVLGWGKSLTTAYDNFPNITGWQMSKLGVKVIGFLGSELGMPSSDPSPSGYTALYLCRDSVGSRSTILDSTSNHYDLSGTFTVLVDGPYP